MLREIHVDESVRALRPDFAVLAIVAEGLANGPTDDAARALLRQAAAAPGGEAHVEAWRAAYRAFGAKPQRTRPSVDALRRRAAAGLPEISRVVDAYNAVSVAHGLPVGGEDLDRYIGPPRLVRAAGDEDFPTLRDGAEHTDHPEIGEVVWRDDAGVTCRRWNWRQSTRTHITEATTRALFLLERLEPMTLAELERAGDALVAALDQVSPGARVAARLIGPASGGAPE
ncbi:B3/B4 domain-containing protein [Allonocardiopsis opalescens]|uniref:DNA/RNA-binding domain of Phe-tRNA-synthetase-like protein n=1 Tax=Allonocardiopsis opalescens TaxID=1144618 RepID=A0A2T0Q6U0_9ACTN|nr:phenylalanine--tRNA ligase beta subunit-related protein [Allonocardiopsis opalescens]PRX99525.1 DNA/RNA-binding domain of Phe-tRNA-synthetase-like protein [Allonocardiopsis opalescens]